jgi:hypothetical protein
VYTLVLQYYGATVLQGRVMNYWGTGLMECSVKGITDILLFLSSRPRIFE